MPFSLARRRAPSLPCGLARSYAVFVYCHPVVFTVARYHSLIVLERSRITTRVSVSFGTSDSHSLVVLVLLHPRHGIMIVIFLHAQRGIIIVVFLPAWRGIVIFVFLPTWHGLRYARQTSLMRGSLPSCPVRPLVCTAVFHSARRGMRGGLPFCLARHARRSSFPSGAECTAVFRSARCGIHGGLPFSLAWPVMCGGVPFCLARPGVHGGVPFCPARHRCSVLSGAARCARQYSILPGAAHAVFFHCAQRSMRGVLPFCPGQHARWSLVPPGAAYVAVFRSIWRGPVCAAVLRVHHRWSWITRHTAG